MLRTLILAVCAAVFLTLCQIDGGEAVAAALGKQPTVVTTKSVAEVKRKAKAIFTGPMQGFKVARETSSLLLFSKELPANVNDNNPLKDRTKGKPVFQVQLRFQPERGKTRVTGDVWMFLNPRGKNKDKFNLLATPDGRRLQGKLYELR